MEASVAERGQITLPKAVRDALGLTKGSILKVELENGRIVMQDTCAKLREKDDIKEFYLGQKDDSVRGERRWKKKKTWR